MKTLPSFRSLARVLAAITLGVSLSSCVEMAMVSQIQSLDAAHARGEISDRDYRATRKAMEQQLAEHQAMVTANLAGASTMAPQDGGGEMVYVYNQSPAPQYNSYSPPPQQQYVYNKPHTLTGGYTPAPQQRYVYNKPSQPHGGYTPAPQQVYVQSPQHQPGGGDYVPAPQQRYVQYPQTAQVGADTVTPPQQKYVNYPSKASKGTTSASKATQAQPTRYDLNGRPLTMTDAELKKASDASLKRTGELAGEVGETAKAVVKESWWSALWHGGKAAKKGFEQVKDLANPTQRTGIVPPAGPIPAPLPDQVKKDLGQ